MTSGQAVTLTYAVPASNPVQDPSGLKAAALTDERVETGDTTPPAPASGEVLAQGNVLKLFFDEDLDYTAADLPPSSAFTVKAGGVPVGVATVIAGADLDELLLELSTNTKIERGQTVTVSYAKPGSGKVIEDAAGNETESFEDFAVTNNSTVVDTRNAMGEPTISGSAVLGETLIASTSGITDPDGKTKAENGDAGHAYTYQWVRVDSDGASNREEISGATSQSYTLAAADVGRKIIVEVSFVDDAGNPEGPLASDPYPRTGTVTATDDAPPVVSYARVDGDELTIAFNETLAAAANLANGAFAVTKTACGGSGQAVSLTGTPSIDGDTVTLTLSPAVSPGDTVTVGYSRPATGTDNRLEDRYGNEVVTFSGQAVTNRTAGSGRNAAPRFDVGRKEIVLASRTIGPGDPVGAPLTATDADGDTLCYSLEAGGYYGERDIKLFTIEEETGQLSAGEYLNTMIYPDYGVDGIGVYVKADDGRGGTDRVFVMVFQAPLPADAPSDVVCRTLADQRGDTTLRFSCNIRPPKSGSKPVTHAEFRYERAPAADHPRPIWMPGPAMVDVGPALVIDPLVNIALHKFEVEVGGLTPGTVYYVSGRAHNADGPGEWGSAPQGTTSGTAPPPQLQRQALSAEFRDAPERHDGAPFKVKMALSDPVANDGNDMRDNVVKVDGGSATNARPVNGQTDLWELTIDPESGKDTTVRVEAGGTCGDPGVLCTAGGDGLSETVTQTVEGEDAGPFTAAFENGPGTHDGTGPFNVFLRFSEAPANVKNIHIKGALTIAGGKILRVRVVGGAGNDEAHRRVEIEPAGEGDVRLSLFPTTDCAATNALCTADGRKLESLIGRSIPGPAEAPPRRRRHRLPSPPRSRTCPKEHRGKTRLDLHVRFSQPPTGGRNAVAASLTMVRAAKWGVKGLDTTGHLYRSALQPHDFRPITVTLNPTANCTAAGALCSAGGRQGSRTGISVTIPGPVAIRVADATVEEAAGAVLAFAVTLDRVRHDTVTVDYATENGTATAGEDYTAASGTLTFAAGETAKTVEVAVLDDAHDEGNETLVLRLSNPSGARIADGEATGTIENTDLMPQAWLARFGRTVAEQVIDAVETRMRAPRSPGAEVSLAGRRIGLGPLFGADAAPEDGEAALAKRARETEAGAEEGQRRLAAWLRGAAEEEERPGLETQTVTERALLLGSSFSLTAAPGDGAPGAVSLWGRAAVSRFDGREDGLTLDGEVASGLLGADWARERSTLGLILSHSRGDGGYRGESGSGTVSSTLTGLYPWGRHALNDRVTVWGVAGYGAGTLTLTPENDDGTPRAAIRTDMDLMMGAVGLRGVVVEAPADGGPELSLKTDALAVRTSSEAVRGSADAGGNLAAAQGDVTRLRLGLEGTWRGLAIGTGTLAPRLEVGVRHDGGDAETGFGLDLGGGLAWSDPGTGIRAEVSGRGLLTHESAGLRERGIAGSFGWDPAPGSNRGPSLSLTQTMGLSATGGADALLGRTTLEGLAANDDGDELDRRRLELRLGYGFGAFGDRFTWTPQAGLGWSESVRETVLGWRLAEERRSGLVFGLDVEGARREPAHSDGEAAHRLGVGLGWRLEGAPGTAFEVRFEGARLEAANDDDGPEHRLGLRMTARF